MSESALGDADPTNAEAPGLGLSIVESEALKRHGFDLVRQLGAGAFGRVYLARQRSLGRDVAVKFYISTFSAESRMRERFQREARLLSRIRCNHIPFVITDGVAPHGNPNGTPYFVMEYVPGVQLAKILENAPIELRGCPTGNRPKFARIVRV